MKTTTLYHYLLPFFWSIFGLIPYATKANQEDATNINTLSSTAKVNKHWYPYPRSIQLRSGCMVHKRDEKLLILLPTTIDLDILFLHPFFARRLDAYPRIGLSFLFPYTFQKEQKLKFPNIWGILGYIELYESNPNLTRWGHRISIGGIKKGALMLVDPQPNYSVVATKEITYHWLFAPAWQLNFGIGLLINWSIKTIKRKPNTNSISEMDQLDSMIKLLNSENDSSIIKLAPLATVGIRYISHANNFYNLVINQIYYKKQKNSRVDCSLMVNNRWLPATQKSYMIFRGSSSLSFAINPHNGLVVSLELGRNNYKKTLLASMLAAEGIELTALLGHEIRYGRCLLQLQLGFELTDSTKLTLQASDEHSLSNVLSKRGSMSINMQYMFTDYLFVGISMRSQEQPGLRLGISF
ncbi:MULTISPECIES: hypothetical protein [unclassified Candidatus Cardinium]|uniref:hypothetical protein n=1 Tax=unclassified Candidatus Cardinium TaxID=2641185 RepID=UPI001FB2AEED|nr:MULTISPECIES: hypothetical protein [unclassified Candidatus Cardinium]